MNTPALIALTFQASHVAIGISRLADSRFVAANEAFLKLLGYTRREVIGSTAAELGIWPIPTQREAVLAQLQRGEAVTAFEGQYRTKDGRIGYALVSASLLKHGDEQYLVGLLTDITARKTAEIALQESEERFRLFMENSPTVAWIKDEDGRIVYLSKTYEDHFGIRFADWRGKTDGEIWPTQTAQAFRENDLNVLATGKPISVVEHATAPDGRSTSWFSTKFPFKDHSGKQYVGGIGLDITDRINAEKAFQDRRERLELALTGSNLGSWDWHIQTGHVSFDARWCVILGYREDELRPEADTLRHLLHPKDKADVENHLKDHLRGYSATYQGEHRLRHKDGHWVWVLTSGKVLDRDANGKPLRMVGTTKDITSRKRLNDEGLTLLQKIESLMREAASGMDAPRGSRKEDEEPLRSLSRRQRQILEMIAAGKTSAQIAQKLKIATATAISHRRALMEKLDLHSTAEITRYAIEHKITSGGD